MRKPRLASVQQHYVRAREVQGDVLCLWAPLSPTRRTYRTILDISPINFLLKAEEEQAALLDRYGALLKALTFPVQILVRNQHLDLRPYLARVQAQASELSTPEARQEVDTQSWLELASDLETFLQHLGSQRTLLTRQCYLVIPAPEFFGTTRHRVPWRKKHRRDRDEALHFRALQELAVRVEMIESQLQSLGLLSRRLGGAELARFYQSCLTPLRALNHPLSDDQLQTVGRLPHVKHPHTCSAASHHTDDEDTPILAVDEGKTETDPAVASHTLAVLPLSLIHI